MKKRYLFVLLMIGSLIFLVGWGKKRVELLNDKKLIDLDAAIEECIPGANAPEAPETSLPAAGGRSDEETPAEAASAAETTDENETIEEKEKVVVISVRDRNVTYDAEEYTDPDKLKARIRRDNGEHVSFQLIDDFAESHVYKKVLSILSDLKAETGLNYTEE